MAALFGLSGDQITPLSATRFQERHVEDDIQRLADANPHFINDGQPMLSLGREITTRHNHAIDNLYLDANGCLVVAEMKRGRTPRDVIAQVVEYAAHVSKLEWSDLEPLCQKRHKTDLETAFRRCFKRSISRAKRPDHRLIVLADGYDPRAFDAALYLINQGTPLTLLQFAYFEIDGRQFFEMRTVLGAIPPQTAGALKETTTAAPPDEGKTNWLYRSLAKAIPDIGGRLGRQLRYRVNKQSLPVSVEGWSVPLADCHLRVDTYKNAVSFRFSARKEVMPGIREYLEEHRQSWHRDFPASFENPPYPTKYLQLGYDVPMPTVGDAGALADITEKTEKVLATLLPVIDGYFENRSRKG